MKGVGKFACLALALVLPCTMVRFARESAEAIDHKVDANSTVALRIAEEGTVLLKNDGMLPLQSTDKIAGLGTPQDSGQVFGGGGSGWVNAIGTVDYRTGLEAAARERYITSYHAIGSPTSKTGENKALYFIAREATEGSDRTPESFELSELEKSDISRLSATYGKENVCVVLNVGSAVDTSWLLEQDVGAIVLAYYGGEQAGNALAHVLTGATNPSGKTVDTWAKSYADYPSSGSIGTFAADRNTLYTEDVYVGYRYFETFDPDYERVNFEFGYGLSYTQFSITEKEAVIEGDKITLKATVKNTGGVAGREVVQAYVSAPQGSWGNPARELVGFYKTAQLAPGQSEKVEIEVDASALADYDDLGRVRKDSWVLPAGEYSFYLGNSVKNAAEGGALGTKFSLAEDRVVETTNALPETDLPERLLADGQREKLNETGGASNVFRVPAHGSVVVQAEDYTSLTPGATSENYYLGIDVGFGLGNLNTAGKEVTYTLDVEEAGRYQIAFSMASAWSGQSDMFNVYVNGVDQTDLVVSMDATHTDQDNRWYDCTLLKGYEIELPAGKVTLRLAANGTNFQNFDCFVLSKASVSPTEETVFEAEMFSSSTGFEQIADGFATKSSDASGSVYTYTFNVSRAGQYDLSVLASNVTAASSEALSVEVNGTEKGAIALRRTATGGSDVFVSNRHVFTRTDSVYIDLTEGSNTLVLKTKDGAVSCIDKLILLPKGDSPASQGDYRDNTDEFAYRSDTAGTPQEETITYQDVYLDRSKADAFLGQLSIEELVRLCGLDRENSLGITNVGGVGGYRIDAKYGIPNAYASDGPAGLRFEMGLRATWFPCMTMLASTWDRDLAEEFGAAVGKEAALASVSVWLAPGVNIHRNPLCGRNFEYFSEDPLLAGCFGASVTKGAQRMGLSVCVKHFTTNNQETNRFANNSCVSVRALREIYLKPFEITVKEGDPHAIMSSYNMLNGKHVAATQELITGVLYEDWGFRGAVFSDWDTTVGHVDMIRSGNTIKSNNPEYANLTAAYKCCIISREQLEINARHCLDLLMATDCGDQKAVTVGVIAAKFTRENAVAHSELGGKSAEGYRAYLPEDNLYELFLTGGAGLKASAAGTELTLENGFALFQGSKGLCELRFEGSKEALASLESFTVKRHVHERGPVCSVCGEKNPDWKEPSSSAPETPPAETDPSPSENTPAEDGCGGVIAGGGALLVLLALPLILKKRK